MTEQEPKTDVKTFTQEDIDKLTEELNAKHQEELTGLANLYKIEKEE